MQNCFLIVYEKSDVCNNGYSNMVITEVKVFTDI